MVFKCISCKDNIRKKQERTPKDEYFQLLQSKQLVNTVDELKSVYLCRFCDSKYKQELGFSSNEKQSDYKSCLRCCRRLTKTLIPRTIPSAFVAFLEDEGHIISSDSSLCARCMLHYKKKVVVPGETNDVTVDVDDDESNESDTVNEPMSINNIFYCPLSHKKCSICFCTSKRLIVLSDKHRSELLLFYNILCLKGSRVCKRHVINCDHIDPSTQFHHDKYSLLSEYIKPEKDKSGAIINELLYHLQQRGTSQSPLDVDALSAESIQNLTGWDSDSINAMLEDISHDLSGPNKKLSPKTALIMFWMKLKTNVSWAHLSSLFGISKSSVSRIYHLVLESLHSKLVPKGLGTSHISREDAMTHNTIFTSTFFTSNVIIMDGTYIYINKSRHHQFQKDSYSGQKKRNLLKFMSVVCPDGYILATIGPFPGKCNDAFITKEMFDGALSDLGDWLKPGDTIILDRGFRDVLSMLSNNGFKPVMPSYMPAGLSQLPPTLANQDRLCTKTRWVVEAYHGRLKQWRFFKETLPSNYFVTTIGKVMQLISACLNLFRPCLSIADEKDRAMASNMMACLLSSSALVQQVEHDPVMLRRSKATWVKLSSCDVAFPEVSLQMMQILTCGIYQVKQAERYIHEHLSESGDYEVWVSQLEENLIRCQIKSRHKSQVKYHCFIRYDLSNDLQPIVDYYCTCPTGARTVGMCAHTASVIFYLGYLRQHPKTLLPYSSQFSSFML